MSQAAMGVPGTAASLDLGTRRRAIISSAVGNFVELYDFLIYGLFAAQIAANFFPKGDPTVALLHHSSTAWVSSCGPWAPSSSAPMATGTATKNRW